MELELLAADFRFLSDIGARLLENGCHALDASTAIDNKTSPSQDLVNKDQLAVELFLRQRSVPLELATDTFGEEGIERLTRLGLAVVAEASLTSTISIILWEGLLIAGDAGGAKAVRKDSVFNISGTTRRLDTVAIQRHVSHAVDFGCGSGAIALRLAARADRVTAIDINPRSIQYTRLNAALNNVTNINAVVGSMFGPVEGECVDLILGNLPFVLSPDQDYLYRDGDRPTIEMLSDAINGAVACLVPGGVAQFLCNWPVSGDNAAASIRKFTEATNCDILVIEQSRRTPIEHVCNWHSKLQAQDPVAFDQVAERWCDWLSENEVDFVSFGVLTLQALTPRGHPPFFGFHTASRVTSAVAGQQIESTLTAYATPGWPHLADEARPSFRAHTLFQMLAHNGTAYVTAPAELVLGASAGVTHMVEPEQVALLIGIDGNTPISTLCSTDEDRQFIEELWAKGFLVFEGTNSPICWATPT